MTRQLDTDAIRKRLEEDRKSLEEQIDTLQLANDEGQADDYGVGHHYGDDATDTMLRARTFPLRDNAEDLIAEIDAAMARLDDGSYGTCARCGQQIDPARLAARPAAIYCINCQGIVDQET